MTEIDFTGTDYSGGADAPIVGQFTIEDATGAASAADSLPTIVTYDRQGTDRTSDLAVTVVAKSTGHYVAYLSAGTFSATDHAFSGPFWSVVTAVVDGVTQKIPLPPFDFRPTHNYAKVVADGSNTATTFKVALVKGRTLAASDDAIFALVTFMTGGLLAGQVAEVDSYNHGTGFLTLKRALTAAPTAGDIFRLINS